MPHHSLAPSKRYADVRRRVFAFSMTAVVLLMILVAILEPRGMDNARMAADHLLRLTSTTSADIGWRQVPALVATGLAAGMLAGMLGMGGGVLKIACMLLILKLDIFFARAISVVTMFFSSSSALWQYHKQKLVYWQYAKPMLVLGVPGAILGTMVGNDLRGASLTHLFGFFMMFLAFNTLALVFADPDEFAMEQEFRIRLRQYQGYRCATIGALHGAICGLLGISGGVIATPLQQILLHMPLRNAIANTLLVSTTVTAVASVFVVWPGVERGDFTLPQIIFVDFFMGGAAALAAPIGAHLGRRSNSTVLRLLFVLLTLGAGLKIVF